MNKKKVLIIAIPVLVLAVSIPSVLFFIHKNKQQVDAARAAVMVHSSEITKETEAGTAGTTSPSMSDGNETQETATVVLHLFENPDKQIQQEIYDNEILLASSTYFTQSGLAGSASASIATSICEQTIEMNASIDSFLGWPNGDEYPDSEYASSRLYISQLIGSMDGSAEVPATNLYPDTPIAAQQFAVKYCLSNRTQFPLDGRFKYCRDSLSEYMKAGHPAITTITSMVLSEDDPKVFEEMSDNLKSYLQATIKTDVGEFFVYLLYERREDGSTGFKILDMTKLS